MTLDTAVYADVRTAISRGMAAGLPAPIVIVAIGGTVTITMARYDDLYAWLLAGRLDHRSFWSSDDGQLACEVVDPGSAAWSAIAVVPFPMLGGQS